MRLFLKGLSARLRHVRRGNEQHRRSRSLVFETLDDRQLLAAAGAASAAAAEGEVAAVEVGQASPVQVVDAESPLWIDQRSSEFSVLQGDGYGYGGGDPPEIVDFVGGPNSGGWRTFTGEVIDDEYVEGLIVTFGGLLEGHSVTVRTDGTFEYAAYIGSGTGLVSAAVTDRDSLTSETVYYMV